MRGREEERRGGETRRSEERRREHRGAAAAFALEGCKVAPPLEQRAYGARTGPRRYTRGGGEMALTPAWSHLRNASPRRRRPRTLPRRHRPCPPPRCPRRCLAPLGRPSGRRRAPQQARLPRGTHIASTGTRSSTSPCAPSGHVLDASTTCPQPRLATSPFRRAPAQATGSARREARPR